MKYYIVFLCIILLSYIYNIWKSFEDEKNKKDQKIICLENLLNDINDEKYFSYYRIQNFRCGYNSTIEDSIQVKKILEKELQTTNKDRYIHQYEKTKIFYTGNINKCLSIDYLHGIEC